MRQRYIWIFAALAGIALIVAAGPSLIFGFDYWYVNKEAKKEMGPYVQEIRDKISGGWGERVSIEPKLVVESLERSAAEVKLQQEKFERKNEIFREPSPPVNGSVDVYQRKLGGLPCNTELHLYLVFDNNDRLVEASGAIFEAGCL